RQRVLLPSRIFAQRPISKLEAKRIGNLGWTPLGGAMQSVQDVRWRHSVFGGQNPCQLPHKWRIGPKITPTVGNDLGPKILRRAAHRQREASMYVQFLPPLVLID
ncbi:unnamed protein product, partial [Sphacelaria rigidula]